MKAIITNDKLEIQDNTLYNSGSIQYYEIDVEFSSDWEGLTKYAVLVGAEKIKLPVVANKLHVDQRTSGTYTIGFVGYTLEDDEKTYQISTNLEYIYFQTGAGEIEANEPSDLPDPTTWETYLSEIQAIVDGAENVNITASKSGGTTTITTTDKTGTTSTTEVLDATINGVTTLTVTAGDNVSLEQEGSTLTISATDTTDYRELSHKPTINNVELNGNKTLEDLGLNYPVTSVNSQIGDVIIDTHDDLIPTQASSSNQLADKNFVTSSIGTATATFRGTYNSLAELQQVTADENDYGFVVSTDSAGNTVYNRYKYASGTWVFEYALNNSSFTQAQWEAIQSGITSLLVGQITTNKNDITTLGSTKANVSDIPTSVTDLTDGADYVKFTNYASGSTAGVIKASTGNGVQVGATSGTLTGATRTLEQYTASANSLIIAKGTLENVLTERIGTIETALTTLDVGGGVQ